MACRARLRDRCHAMSWGQQIASSRLAICWWGVSHAKARQRCVWNGRLWRLSVFFIWVFVLDRYVCRLEKSSSISESWYIVFVFVLTIVIRFICRPVMRCSWQIVNLRFVFTEAASLFSSPTLDSLHRRRKDDQPEQYRSSDLPAVNVALTILQPVPPQVVTSSLFIRPPLASRSSRARCFNATPIAGHPARNLIPGPAIWRHVPARQDVTICRRIRRGGHWWTWCTPCRNCCQQSVVRPAVHHGWRAVNDGIVSYNLSLTMHAEALASLVGMFGTSDVVHSDGGSPFKNRCEFFRVNWRIAWE